MQASSVVHVAPANGQKPENDHLPLARPSLQPLEPMPLQEIAAAPRPLHEMTLRASSNENTLGPLPDITQRPLQEAGALRPLPDIAQRPPQQ